MQADDRKKTNKSPIKYGKRTEKTHIFRVASVRDPLCKQDGLSLIKSQSFAGYLRKNQSPKVMLGLRGLSLKPWSATTLGSSRCQVQSASEEPCLLLWPKVHEAFQLLTTDHADRLACYLGLMMRSDMLQAFFEKASPDNQKHYVEILQIFVIEHKIRPRVMMTQVHSHASQRKDHPIVYMTHSQILHMLATVLGRFACALPLAYFIDLLSGSKLCDETGTQSKDQTTEMMSMVLKGLFEEREACASSGRSECTKTDRLHKEKAVALWCQRQLSRGMGKDELCAMLSLLYQHQAYHAFFLFYDAVARSVYASLQSSQSSRFTQLRFTLDQLQALTTTALDVGVYYRAQLPAVTHALNSEYSRLTKWCRRADTITADQTLAEYAHRVDLAKILQQWSLFLRRVLQHSWQRHTNAHTALIKQWVHVELLRCVFDDTFVAVDFVSSLLAVFPDGLDPKIKAEKMCNVVTIFLDISRVLYAEIKGDISIAAKLRGVWSLLHVRLLRYGYDLALAGQDTTESGLNKVVDRVCSFIEPNFSTCLYWTPAYRHQIEHYLFALCRENSQVLSSDVFLFWHQFAQSQSRKLELVNQQVRARIQQTVQANQLPGESMLPGSVLEALDVERPCAFDQNDPFVSAHSPVRGSYLLDDEPIDSIIVPVSPGEASSPDDSGFLSAYRGASSLDSSGFWSAHRTPPESQTSSHQSGNSSLVNTGSFFRSVSSQMSPENNRENDLDKVMVFDLPKSIW